MKNKESFISTELIGFCENQDCFFGKFVVREEEERSRCRI